jgi:DNA-binding XRE family transcriptional regulator
VNEFTRVFNELGMTKTELTTLLNAPRNTIFNYLNGSVTNMPASAVTLITLLAFIKQHHPRAFEEWGEIARYNKNQEKRDGNTLSLFDIISDEVLFQGIVRHGELRGFIK